MGYSLTLKRLFIDAPQELIVYVHADCLVCQSEGLETQTQVRVLYKNQSILATLHRIGSNALKPGEASLSENAWNVLHAQENASIRIAHFHPASSLNAVRQKIHGQKLDAPAYETIMQDIMRGSYSNLHIASFITALERQWLDHSELKSLTQAMINTGERMSWAQSPILDKHSIGGIPGNRTTPVVVAIVAAAGLIIPKSSSRAITSPSGTADTIETMMNVSLSPAQMRQVVEREGGCMIWGGTLGVCPVDDRLIRVERALNLDPLSLMIASVLCKKIAMGATHLVLDVPTGDSAKIKAPIFPKLASCMIQVAQEFGLKVHVVQSHGIQPVGIGIGPCLEARDVLAVLKNQPHAPLDLRNKALDLAGILLELGQIAPPSSGRAQAELLLNQGLAYQKFMNIAIAQGGFKEPRTARHTHEILASHDGIIVSIQLKYLSQLAKLAGAPHHAAAGIECFVQCDDRVSRGQPLLKIHAEHPAALHYALHYAVHEQPNLFTIIPESV